jgi:tRNA(fMet)-specific endonuclease VapC
VIYLLDTNVCIALINDNDPRVRDRFRRASAVPATIAVPTVVAFELWYGVANSGRQVANADQLEAFFRGPIDLLPFDGEDARVAGLIRAALRSVGGPIGAYDTLIAGQALRRGLTLVTANAQEFSRVAGLAWEDWAAPAREG